MPLFLARRDRTTVGEELERRPGPQRGRPPTHRTPSRRGHRPRGGGPGGRRSAYDGLAGTAPVRHGSRGRTEPVRWRPGRGAAPTSGRPRGTDIRAPLMAPLTVRDTTLVVAVLARPRSPRRSNEAASWAPGSQTAGASGRDSGTRARSSGRCTRCRRLCGKRRLGPGPRDLPGFRRTGGTGPAHAPRRRVHVPRAAPTTGCAAARDRAAPRRPRRWTGSSRPVRRR
jgi:hypothetical protein